MSDHLDETVEKLAALQRQHRERTTRSQRLANRVTRSLGSPLAIAVLTLVVLGWIVGNMIAEGWHRAVEQQPFPDLALGLGFVAVVIALLILTTQRHDEELAEKRAELTLQIALLSERKVAKIIALLEEQRRDNPLLTSRIDVEAEQMAHSADPEEALSLIEGAQS